MGWWSNLTNIFQGGWNHQLANVSLQIFYWLSYLICHDTIRFAHILKRMVCNHTTSRSLQNWLENCEIARNLVATTAKKPSGVLWVSSLFRPVRIHMKPTTTPTGCWSRTWMLIARFDGCVTRCILLIWLVYEPIRFFLSAYILPLLSLQGC